MAAFQTPEIDMLHGPLCGKLLRYTLPIALSSILQQLFQAADTAVVGRFASADALAAVGTNTETTALIVTVSAGLAVGQTFWSPARSGRGDRAKRRQLCGRPFCGRCFSAPRPRALGRWP